MEATSQLKEKHYILAWLAGFIVLIFSLILLGLCTFFSVRNLTLVKTWETILFVSLGYVVGIPIGAMNTKKEPTVARAAQ